MDTSNISGDTVIPKASIKKRNKALMIDDVIYVHPKKYKMLTKSKSLEHALRNVIERELNIPPMEFMSPFQWGVRALSPSLNWSPKIASCVVGYES